MFFKKTQILLCAERVSNRKYYQNKPIHQQHRLFEMKSVPEKHVWWKNIKSHQNPWPLHNQGVI